MSLCGSGARRRAPMLSIAVVGTLVLLVGPLAAPVDAGGRVTYRPPVDAPVFDPWRAPAGDYGAGNRGIDYSTSPGQDVLAAAPGVVTFAGAVGSSLHVTVLHDDGIRTTYSFLQGLAVVRGQRVAAGMRVGSASRALHFGARAGDAYLDPAVLFGGGPIGVRLVPDQPRTVAEERRGIAEMLKGWAEAGARLTGHAAGWLLERAGEVAELAAIGVDLALFSVPDARRIAVICAEWSETRKRCTRREVRPPRIRSRRIVIRVGGLGSSASDGRLGGSIGNFRALELGYARDDVVDFSYHGGSVDAHGYTPEETQQDLRISGHRLALLIRDLQRRNPGVPVDLVAHSQGGIVSRLAVGELGAPTPGRPTVENLITLATPHTGSNLTEIPANIADNPFGELVANHAVASKGLDPNSPAMQQLRPGSELLRTIPPLPPSVRATSIAAEGDLAVTGTKARLDGADNRIVDVGGFFDDHGRITASPAAMREVALALHGLPETCKSLVTALRQGLTQQQRDHFEQVVGRTLDRVTGPDLSL